jgi:splicing factor 3A subunit 1
MAAKPNGDATPNGGTDIHDEISSRAPAGLVLPPRNIRELVEKLADYIARNGKEFEEKVRVNQGHLAKMSFLNPEDEYYPYYQWRITENKEGRGATASAGRKTGEVSFQGREARKGPEKQDDYEFSARMPVISAQDLEVVKLTALYVAKNGRGWMTQLSQREAANSQFDFLRPQHSLYQFFSRLVDQYSDLLQGDSVDGGRPQKKRIVELEANVSNRFRILERAKKRAEWVKYQEAQKVEREEKDEAEKVAYAQIDWHDFVVVETVVFDEEDQHRQLPAPTSLNDVQSRSLEQKAAWGNDPSRRIEEAMPDFGDYDDSYGQAAQAPQGYTPIPGSQPAYAPPPQDDSTQAHRERARAAQEAARAQQHTPVQAANNPNAIKMRSNYTPAANTNRKPPPNTSLCPNCGQHIPNDEIAQHMRIEMLNPDWKGQWKVAQQRSATTNLSTADVAANLKRLASQRTDVFDPVTGRAVDGGGKRQEVQQGVPAQVGQDVMGVDGGAAGANGGQGSTTDVQEQIRLIHERARNG